MNPYDHPEYRAQLAGIIAVPEDDLKRLVLADWLEEMEQDDATARAEFIRVQIRITELLAVAERWANTPSDMPGGSREDGATAGAALADAQSLQRRERELIDADESAGWKGFLLSYEDRMTVERMDHEPVWRRGFIDELRTDGGTDTTRVLDLMRRHPVRVLQCTLADWIGGECPHCLGVDGISAETYLTDCTRCHGLGTLPGIGPAVVAAHPVERVTLTDVRPVPGSGGYWYWEEEWGEELTSRHVAFGELLYSAFESERAADDAMSAVLLSHARRPRFEQGTADMMASRP